MGKKIKLVLSGSGTLYPVHAGAIQCLIQSGYEIEEICGVSGGAIIAAAIASGYKPNIELVKLIKQTLPGKNNLIDPSLWSLATKWGLIKGEKIEKTLEKFFVKTLADTKIPLKIATTNVNLGCSQFFTTDGNPEVSLAQAVHASMAIPFVFAPVKIGDDLFVDGGWVSNFPLDVFGDNNKNTVGICFAQEEKKKKKVSSLKDYIMTLIGSSIDENVKEDTEDAVHGSVINLTSRHSNLNFGTTEKDVDEMVAEGYAAAENALRAGRILI